ncbi:MAG: molybdopterin molybdotransferase MoeA [Candidatus Andeanibacterium colombiense]|uniref:Molybdopterin molybdenumtransferase n=1 Tax=Candidatus Andeanibacterium colombiense TaxID=3121345 RepID=A0AAJ5X978_9SPHN|nr:MAG: molybdopterin molybdotransferase MoeA [Sphingomonadaceae bacterium]
MSTRHTAPIPLSEAQQRLLAQVEPLPAEEVLAEAAVGRCLAEPLLARRTQPAADLSAMDGYAMKAGESGPWQVVGESAAGHPFSGTLGPGEAIRISTGALMPDGGETVLLQENATREGDRLSLNGEGDPDPRHIRRKGFDFREGDTVLSAGVRIGPGQLGLALSAGSDRLTVHRLPRLAILDSGDELATDFADLTPHRIPASNGAMLAAMTARLSSERLRLGPVPDDLDALAKALETAGDADVIVTSGGASVGDHDLIYPALEAWGAEIDFWRVKMKPGKPILIARKGKQMVLGLPGNPVSSFVTGFLFLLPLLRALAGDRDPLPRPVMLPLGAGIPAGGQRLELRRALMRDGAVNSLEEQDSSALRTLAIANALIERPAEAPAAAAGTLVPAYWLGNG